MIAVYRVQAGKANRTVVGQFGSIYLATATQRQLAEMYRSGVKYVEVYYEQPKEPVIESRKSGSKKRRKSVKKSK